MSIYVSITGLTLRRPWHAFRFYWYAIPSIRQARAAEGNLHTAVKTVNGVHHTLTAWRDEQAMRAFLQSGAHGRAMRSFDDFAEGKTFGFEAVAIPSWDEALTLWRAMGRDVRVMARGRNRNGGSGEPPSEEARGADRAQLGSGT